MIVVQDLVSIELLLNTSPFRKKFKLILIGKIKLLLLFFPSFNRVTVFYLAYYLRNCTFRCLEKGSLITMDKKDSLKQFKSSETVSRNGTGFDSELFLQNRVKN